MNGRKTKIQKFDELCSIYGKENVLLIIDEIKDRNKDILLAYFGLRDGNPVQVKKIAKNCGLTEISVYKVIDKGLERIENCLKYPQISVETFMHKKSFRLIKIFEKYGVDKVLENVDKLDEEEKQRVKSYYGIKPVDVSIQDNTEVSNNVHGIMRKIINKLENKQDIRIGRSNSRLRNIYEKHGLERLMEAINSLGEKSQIIMKLYLGIEGEPKTSAQISEITGVKVGSINTMIGMNIKKIDEILNVDLNKTYVRKKFSLIRMYKKHGKQRFLDKIYSLNESEKDIVLRYYGIGFDEASNGEKMAKKLNVDVEAFYKMLNTIMCKIDRSLTYADDKKKMVVEIKYSELCELYGKENVGLAISTMIGRYKEITQYYFGINGEKKAIEKIIKEYSIYEKRAFEIIEACLIEVSSIMIDDMPSEIKKLLDLYGKNSVKIAMKRLQEDVTFLEMYKQGGANREELIEDLCFEIFDVNEESLPKEVLIKKRRERFKISVSTSDKEKVKKALSLLNQREQMLICLYYGLDNEHVCNIVDLSKKLNIKTKCLRDEIKNILSKINGLIINQSR